MVPLGGLLVKPAQYLEPHDHPAAITVPAWPSPFIDASSLRLKGAFFIMRWRLNVKTVDGVSGQECAPTDGPKKKGRNTQDRPFEIHRQFVSSFSNNIIDIWAAACNPGKIRR